MTKLLFLKMVSDLLLYFALLMGYNGRLQSPVLPIVTSIIMAFGVVIASKCENRKRRYFGLLSIPILFICEIIVPAMLSLITVKSAIIGAFVLAVPSIYIMWVIIKQQFELYYYSYRSILKTCMLIFFIAFFLIIAENVFGNMAAEVVSIASPLLPGIYGGLSLIFGFYVLRKLRFTSNTKESRKRIVLDIVIIVLICVAAGAVILLLLDNVNWSYFKILLTPLALLAEWFRILFSERMVGFYDALPTASGDPERNPLVIISGESEYFEFVPSAKFNLETLVIIIGIIVAVLILVVMLRKAFYVDRGLNIIVEEEEYEETKKKKTRLGILSDRDRARREYKEYLKRLKKKGVQINNHMTTKEIYEAIPKNLRTEEDLKMRNKYLPHRYK